jgi:hypothetical protein
MNTEKKGQNFFILLINQSLFTVSNLSFKKKEKDKLNFSTNKHQKGEREREYSFFFMKLNSEERKKTKLTEK